MVKLRAKTELITMTWKCPIRSTLIFSLLLARLPACLSVCLSDCLHIHYQLFMRIMERFCFVIQYSIQIFHFSFFILFLDFWQKQKGREIKLNLSGRNFTRLMQFLQQRLHRTLFHYLLDLGVWFQGPWV